MKQWGRLEELEDPGSGRDIEQQPPMAPHHLSAVWPQFSSQEKRRKKTCQHVHGKNLQKIPFSPGVGSND